MSYSNVFNIATGKSVSINELAQLMIRIAGSNLEPIYEQERKGDIRFNKVDVTKSKNILGFVPHSNVESDLEELLNQHQNLQS